MQLVQLVATEVFQSALDVAREMDPDLIKLPLSGAQPSIREDTWIEVGCLSAQRIQLPASIYLVPDSITIFCVHPAFRLQLELLKYFCSSNFC